MKILLDFQADFRHNMEERFSRAVLTDSLPCNLHKLHCPNLVQNARGRRIKGGGGRGDR